MKFKVVSIVLIVLVIILVVIFCSACGGSTWDYPRLTESPKIRVLTPSIYSTESCDAFINWVNAHPEKRIVSLAVKPNPITYIWVFEDREES